MSMGRMYESLTLIERLSCSILQHTSRVVPNSFIGHPFSFATMATAFLICKDFERWNVPLIKDSSSQGSIPRVSSRST